MSTAPHFNLPIGQWIELDGLLYRFNRRGVDRQRRMVFEGLEGVPKDMTDEELLDFQYGSERRLKLLTQAEASDRLAEAKKPRMTIIAANREAGDKTRHRMHYIRAWVNAGRPSRTEEAVRPLVLQAYEDLKADVDIIEAKPPSARQVLRWIRDYVSSGGDFENLVPQTQRRGNTTDRLHPKAREILEEVVDEYYLVSTRPTAVAVHKHVLAAFARYNEALPASDCLTVPSIKAVRRIIQGIDRYTLDCTRLGRRAADHRWRPVMSAPQTTRHNEVWEIDHTLVDAIVVDDATGLPLGRPWVTCIIDRHTRMVMGFNLGFDPPSAYSALEALRHAIQPKRQISMPSRPKADEAADKQSYDASDWPAVGTPETLVTDQGKEFKSRAFLAACNSLGMQVEYTPVLKAWYKGKIERFFRTLTTDVFQRVPGTTFSNVFERNKEDIPETVAICTLAELRRQTLNFVVDVYHKRPHRGLATSPLHAWNESTRIHGLRPLPNPEKILAALARTETRTLQRYGIEFEGLLYNSAEVADCRIHSRGSCEVALSSTRTTSPAFDSCIRTPASSSSFQLSQPC